MTSRFLSSLTRIAFAIAILFVLQGGGSAQTLSNNYSDIKPGSILFFNRYTSNPANPQQGDTQFNITNLNQSKDALIHLFLIDGSTCSVADFGLSLTPNQTISILMSDYDPGIYGYMIAVAESFDTGLPTQFNWLAGSAYIRENDGRKAILPAISIGKVSAGDIAPTNGEYKLKFNGADYEKLPSGLAVISFDSQVLAQSTLYIYTPPTNLFFGDVTTVNVFTLLYDDAEKSLSSSFTVTCYRQDSFITLFNRGGGINRHVPPGRTGWLKFSASGGPILGSVITRGAVFEGGYNLHAFALLGSYEITLPVF